MSIRFKVARARAPILGSLMLILAVTGCTVGVKPAAVVVAPSVTVTQPTPKTVLPLGQAVNVDSTSVAEQGIQRVELWVDNVLVRVDVNPDAGSPYIVSQPWTSDQVGSHVIQVKAYDAAGAVGQSQPVVVTLSETEQEETVTVVSSPTSGAPSATPTSESEPESASGTATETPFPVCTPPACQAGEVYTCAGNCPGGCGTNCATPTLGPPTPTPPTYKPTGIDPHPALKSVWEKPAVKAYLGYAFQPAADSRHYARQHFERGFMYWLERPDQPGQIWVLEMPDPSAAQGYAWSGPYDDVWDGNDKYSCDAARHTALGPVSGFGKLWCDKPDIALAIGEPREPELGTGESTDFGIVQYFQGGTMLYSPLEHQVWVLFAGGTWQRYVVS